MPFAMAAASVGGYCASGGAAGASAAAAARARHIASRVASSSSSSSSSLSHRHHHHRRCQNHSRASFNRGRANPGRRRGATTTLVFSSAASAGAAASSTKGESESGGGYGDVEVITFDLDDTLWPTHPVVMAANQAFVDFCQARIPGFPDGERVNEHMRSIREEREAAAAASGERHAPLSFASLRIAGGYRAALEVGCAEPDAIAVVSRCGAHHLRLLNVFWRRMHAITTLDSKHRLSNPSFRNVCIKRLSKKNERSHQTNRQMNRNVALSYLYTVGQSDSIHRRREVT